MQWARHKHTGFTIVELLIVIVVIAILAAITVVAYTGIQSQAYDSAIKSDIQNFAKKMELYKAENSTYPPMNGLTSSMGIKLTKDAYGRDSQDRNASYCVNTTTDRYIYYALSKSGKYFQIRSDTPLEETSAATGYNICTRVGVASTQPNQGVLPNNVWQAWAN
ncbi:type II secretion system GspH family protein [Candidatus Saccharibacteria bacterium]|nr:type II secretion system GspH family protein [Candidatus Saccharibacteria bacterium]